MNGGADRSSVTVYEFDKPNSWPGDKWYRHLPVPDLWDPAAAVTCTGNGTLAIDARRFTLTRRDGHDNVKALTYTDGRIRPGRTRPAHA